MVDDIKEEENNNENVEKVVDVSWKQILSGKNILLLFCLFLIITCCFVIGYCYGLRNGTLDGFRQCQDSYLTCNNAMLSGNYYVDLDLVTEKDMMFYTNFSNNISIK